VRAPCQVYNRESGLFVNNVSVSGEPDYMYFSNVSDIRPEDVHPFVKPRNKNQLVRLFDKERSVFAPWKQETPAIVEAAFEIDMDNNRCSKLIKDPDEVSANTQG